MKRNFSKILSAVLVVFMLFALLPMGRLTIMAADIAEQSTEDVSVSTSESTEATEGETTATTDGTVEDESESTTESETETTEDVTDETEATEVPDVENEEPNSDVVNEADEHEEDHDALPPSSPTAISPLGGGISLFSASYVWLDCNISEAPHSHVLYDNNITISGDYTLPTHLAIRGFCGGYTSPEWELAGWSQDSNTSPYDPALLAPGTTVTPNTDDTFYAIWRRVTINVTYRNDAGNVVSATVPAANDIVVSQLNNVAGQGVDWSKGHYTFGGWISGSNIYAPGTVLTGPFSADIDFVTNFTPNLVYHQDATPASDYFETPITGNGTYPAPKNEWNSEGSKFVGWAADPNETNPANMKTPGAPITENGRGGPAHLYAIYKQLMSVTYNVGGYGHLDNVPGVEICEDGTTYQVVYQIPIWGGHEFTGWNLFGTDTMYQPGDTFIMPNNNITLVAHWRFITPTNPGTSTPGGNSGGNGGNNGGNSGGGTSPSTPTDAGNSGGTPQVVSPVGPGSTPEPTPAFANNSQSAQNTQNGEPTATISGEEETPLHVPVGPDGMTGQGDSKTLLNLILTIFSFFLMVLMASAYVLRRRAENNEDDQNEQVKKYKAMQLLGIPLFIAALLLFLFTQRFTGPWILADKWTIPLAIFPLAQIIVNMMASTKKTEQSESANQ